MASMFATHRRSLPTRRSTRMARRSTTASDIANGTVVDNIEDVDTAVGYLAEFRHPHGFAISETQFVVFILNASRRLFSDRFFTSSFRPEFYTTLGIDWVNNNGPGPAHDGTGRSERPCAAGIADEADADAQHSGTESGIAERGQRLRSMGTRPGQVLQPGVEAAPGSGVRRFIRKPIAGAPAMNERFRQLSRRSERNSDIQRRRRLFK